MARLTKQQLKQDELGEQLGVGLDYMMHHKSGMMKWVGLVVASLVLVIGVMIYLRSRGHAAAAALGGALDTYHATISAEPQTNPAVKTFKTDKERLEASLKEFTTVASEHGSSGPGRWAKYYVALSNAGLEKYSDAEKDFQALASEGDADLSASAKFALAGVQLKQNKPAEAEKLLKELIEKPSRTIPKATAQLALADYYRSAKPAEAKKIYQELAKDFPETSIAEMANLRIGEIPAN